MEQEFEYTNDFGEPSLDSSQGLIDRSLLQAFEHFDLVNTAKTIKEAY